MSVEWFWSSSILILLVVLIRFLFREKIRPCMRYALWLIVAIRLLIPFSLAETAVSVLNLLPEQDVAEAVQDDAQVGQSDVQAEDLKMINIEEKAEVKVGIETDVQNQWLSCQNRGDGQYSVTYYRYDAEDKLHMLRYVEKDSSKDAVLKRE